MDVWIWCLDNGPAGYSEKDYERRRIFAHHYPLPNLTILITTNTQTFSKIYLWINLCKTMLNLWITYKIWGVFRSADMGLWGYLRCLFLSLALLSDISKAIKAKADPIKKQTKQRISVCALFITISISYYRDYEGLFKCPQKFAIMFV